MADIAEQICLAIDQIVGERLKSINYDTTITATIVSDKDAKNYKYTCSNGSAQFIAFSKDTTYKKGDSVQVTIPNNDYDQQKIIIGKYVAKDATPFVFVQPFETIIDVSANIIRGNENSIQSSLIANDNYSALGEPFIVEQLLYSKYFNEGYKGYNRLGLKGQFRSWLQGLRPIKGNYGYRLEILSSSPETLKDSVITSWVKLYSDFLEGKNIPEKDAIFQATPEDWFVNLTDTSINTKTKYVDKFNLNATPNNIKSQMLKDILNLKLKIDKVYLDSEEMYGNPYNFQSYFEQEKVYDITSIDTIVGMNLYFYEISGSFINELGDPIPYLIDEKNPDRGKKANLFTKDPYICLGYDLSGFDKEQAILYCLDGDTFLIKDSVAPDKNIKNINLRWLHEFKDGEIKVINNIGQLEKKDTPCEIRWYRFEMGAASADEYSGVYWKRDLDPTKDLDYINKQCESFNELKTKVLTEKTVEQMKTIVEDLLKKYPLHNEIFKKVTPAEKIGDKEVETYTLDIDKKNKLIQEEITNKKLDISSFKYTLHPATNVESEKIKAVILYDGKIISSNILTFTNEDKEGISNAATAKTVAGLSIWCADGSYGNYFVYGQNNQILENSKLNANTIQILQAKFADASLLASEYDIDKNAPDLKEAKQIIWEFPLRNSMIEVDGFNYSFKYLKSEYIDSDNPSLGVNYSEVIKNDKANDGARYKKAGYFADARIEVKEQTNQIFIIRDAVNITNANSSNDDLEYEINSQQKYRIKNFYSASNANNTVKCTIQKNNMQYSAIKEFSFGLRGTSGTDATLVIDFDNNKTALTAGNISEALKLTAHLYDSTYKEVDFNDMSLGLKCEWSWAVYNQDFESNDIYQYFITDSKLRTYTDKYFTEKKFDVNSVDYQMYESLKKATSEDDLQENEKEYFEKLIYKLQSIYNQNFNNNFNQYFVANSQLRTYTDKYFSEEKFDVNSVDYQMYESLKKATSADDLQENEKEYFEKLIYKLQSRYSQEYGYIQIDEDETGESNICQIYHNNTDKSLDIDRLNLLQVLQVKVKGWGNYDLIAYKAIPIRKDRRYRNIVGPVDIIYGSNGTVDYNKIEYEIWGCDSLDDIDNDADVVLNDIKLIPLKNQEGKNFTWQIHNVFDERPDLIGTFKRSDNNKPETQANNILRPAVMYTKDAYSYGVKCVDITTGNILWIQPLVILQNRYPSATLNAWDGEGIEINEKEGYIISPAIAAGKKNEDNSFSGVMLGDWSKTQTEDSITKQTGLYGFHYGAQSFAFKEDGTAFIGKSGLGRIEFNGNSGVIKSSAWDSLQAGMFLDLDDGVLKLQKNSQYEQVKITSTDYSASDNTPNKKYYVFESGYNEVPLEEEWSADKDYYLFKIKDLGLLTRNEFLTKQSDNNGTFYEKNITYQEINSDFTKDKEYFIDGFSKVIISKEQYDESLKDNGTLGKKQSIKYYVVLEEFDLSMGHYSDKENYYTKYQQASVSEAQYKESLSNNKSNKYYILKETFELSPNENYSEGTTYYINIDGIYHKETITKEQYDKAYDKITGKSTTYYIKIKEEYVFSEGDFSSSQIYWVIEYQGVSISKATYDEVYDEMAGRSTKYYVRTKAEYVLGEDNYSAGTSYFMKNKVKVELNDLFKLSSNIDYFAETYYYIKTDDNNYQKETITKEQYDEAYDETAGKSTKYYVKTEKAYIITNVTYNVITTSSIFSEIKEYAEYNYTQCYYNVTGPANKDTVWNTKDDPNLVDNIKYTASNLGKYYTFLEGFFLDTRPTYTEGEIYYIFNQEQEQRFITLSAQEIQYPLSIGTTNAVAQRKFRVEWDGTVWIENGNISGIINADELYCNYGYIGGWEIDDRTLTGGKTVLHSQDGIYTNRVGIIEKVSTASSENGLLGEIGLVYGATGQDTTYNIGIVSKNQSIVLDTMSATGNTSNIAFRSKSGCWAQCSNFYIMGNSEGWQSNALSSRFFVDEFSVNNSKKATIFTEEFIIEKRPPKGSESVNLKFSVNNALSTTFKTTNFSITNASSVSISASDFQVKNASTASISASSTITLTAGSSSITLSSGSLAVSGVTAGNQTGIYARFA